MLGAAKSCDGKDGKDDGKDGEEERGGEEDDGRGGQMRGCGMQSRVNAQGVGHGEFAQSVERDSKHEDNGDESIAERFAEMEEPNRGGEERESGEQLV